MEYIKTFEKFENSGKILMIVDVQKSFKKFFNDLYVNELKKYCNKFDTVYQLFDNHVDGKNVDKDYLYDREEEAQTDHKDLYDFPNQIDVIEKRYRYNVSLDFFKKIIDSKTFAQMKSKEEKNQLKVGDIVTTKMGTILVFINNNHRWFECPKKLYDIFQQLKGKEVIIVGGAREECLKDVVVAAEALGVIVKINFIFTYSATQCYF